MLFGAERTYCHLFFGLGDGGALAFFQFANQSDQELFGPKMPDTPFHHIALKVDADDAEGASSSVCTRPATRSRRHSCSSTAIAARCMPTDPDGMIVEFTRRSSGRREDQRDAARGCACGAQALARRAITPRTTCIAEELRR